MYDRMKIHAPVPSLLRNLIEEPKTYPKQMLHWIEQPKLGIEPHDD